MTAKTRRRNIPDFGQRLRAIFPQAKSMTRGLMIALDRSQTSVEDIMAGRNVPPDVEIIVELIERSTSLPKRWRISELGRHVRAKKPAVPEWVATAQEMIDSGMVDAEIARRVNVAPSALLRARSKGFIRGQNKQPSAVADIQRLIDCGLPDTKIAEALGIHSQTISYHRKRGVLRGQNKWIGKKGGPPERFDRAEAARLNTSGVSIKEIARRFGVSGSAVTQALKKFRAGSANDDDK